jgi:hypothetical protein
MTYVQFSYFGYSCSFATSATTVAERRQQANERVIAKFGKTPRISYVEPGVPFPDFVPMLTWDAENQEFN